MLTGDPSRPEAHSILFVDGRVAALDAAQEAGEVVRLQADALVVPGFVDAHVHLLAMAAARVSVDCSAAATIDEVLDALRDASGAWARGTGFDDALIAEHRYPSLAELDAAVPERPLVLHHATGHAVTANSAARTALGLPRDDEPVAASRVAGRAPRIERRELLDALDAVGLDLLAHGVTAVCDATVTNGVEEIEVLTSRGLPQKIVVMPGAGKLGEVRDAGLRYGRRIGHAKLYVEDDDTVRDVRAVVEHVHRSGWPVAVHVLDVGPLDVALDALAASSPPPGTTDRLEHVALCLPEQRERIGAAGVEVVTQPAFVTRRARKYAAELSGVERDWLYPIASLHRAGVRVAFSSDAPVVPARPMEAIAAATQREAGERIAFEDAIAMATANAAAACGLESGRLAPGRPADAVVIDRSGSDVLATVRGGVLRER